ncbi:hypothetical protein ACFPRL_27520 [Pseudoclavibacter helvolus]
MTSWSPVGPTTSRNRFSARIRTSDQPDAARAASSSACVVTMTVDMLSPSVDMSDG